jgi:hypothetical protein
MMAAERIIRWTTAGAVLGVATVAAVASYEHACALVRMHEQAGWTGRVIPLTVDGLIYASSMVMLDAARRKLPVPALARLLLGLGIATTLAANVAHGLGHGLIRAAVAAWPAVALVGSYELLMLITRDAHEQPNAVAELDALDADPLQIQATQVFADNSRSRAFPRYARFALGFMSDSHAPSGYAVTLPGSRMPEHVTGKTDSFEGALWVLFPAGATANRHGNRVPLGSHLIGRRVSWRAVCARALIAHGYSLYADCSLK